jgi:TolB protein
MLFHRSLCIGLLLLPALPAFGQRTSAPHRGAQRRAVRTARASASVPDPRVRVAMLPTNSPGTDSVETIVTRDLGFGDRVRVVTASEAQNDATTSTATPTATPAATPAVAALVRIVAAERGITVSLVDPLSNAVRQQRDFPLPVVVPRNDQAIADSLNQAFTARYLTRSNRLMRAYAVRDSIQGEMAKKPPRLRGSDARAAYSILVTQRDSVLSDALTEMARVRDEGKRDEAARAEVQSAAIERAMVVRDSTMLARRWAIHGVSDAVEEWLTGHRGIAQSRVAYVSNGAIRVVDFDGANDHAVTHTDSAGVRAMSPAWRADGAALAYSEMRDAGTQIVLIDLTTGQTRSLAATPRGLNVTPVFSADGKWLIYANGTDARMGLVAVRPDSVASLKRLPVSRLFDADEPVLSPDGMRIAYVSARPRTPQIYSSNLDGTDEQVEAPSTTGARVYRTSPAWSPDGRMIAYQQQDGDFQVWVVNRADRSVRRLTVQGENEDPTWAPDSRHIALTSNRGGTKDIWVLDLQSGRFRQLTHAGDARLAAWSEPIVTPPSMPLVVTH